MKKIIIIGSPGAGKSTFARKLKEIVNLPLYYLDMIWHKVDKTNISREEFDLKLKEILEKEEWIIDGNYQRTLKMRIEKCDTIFLLDIPLLICLNNVSNRICKKREDMAWIEEEFDEDFKNYIINFQTEMLPKIYDILEEYKEEKKIIILKSYEDIEKYFKNYRKNNI